MVALDRTRLGEGSPRCCPVLVVVSPPPFSSAAPPFALIFLAFGGDADSQLVSPMLTCFTTAPPTARYPAGQPICRNYHISYCPGWCGRAHNICPKKLADGTYCFGNHALRQCTRT